MTMIERVANAYRGKVMELVHGSPDILMSEVHRQAARAAIEAMREPTPGMLGAGGLVEDSESAVTGDWLAGKVWSAMIAAALGEP